MAAKQRQVRDNPSLGAALARVFEDMDFATTLVPIV